MGCRGDEGRRAKARFARAAAFNRRNDFMTEKTGAAARRATIRQSHFAGLDLWTGEKETGWFPMPRTLPLILSLIDSKDISDKKKSSSVYLELLSRHRSDGVIEMGKESEHAFAAGYQGSRAIRTWRERMLLLEKHHFIVTKQIGNDRFGYVALTHPSTAVHRLHGEKRVPEIWMTAYLHRKMETKEPTHEKRMEKLKAARNVVPIAAAKNAKPAADASLLKKKRKG
jgi:hypothetical protein